MNSIRGSTGEQIMTRYLACSVLLATVFAASCERSLDSIEGPVVGTVWGVACNDLATLNALVDVPAMESSFIKAGTCQHLQGDKVKVVRTVQMPGSGKYSQLELAAQGTTRKLWVATSKLS